MEDAAARARQAQEKHKQELLEGSRALALSRANAQDGASKLRAQEGLLEEQRAVIQGVWWWSHGVLVGGDRCLCIWKTHKVLVVQPVDPSIS